jgi:MoaA/NifB/PqqE/SkfB family radical SAM enzyme
MKRQLPRNKKRHLGYKGVELAGWSFDERDIEAAVRGEVFLNSSLDLANPFNLNCPYCFIEEKLSLRKVRKPNELTVEEALLVINDFVEGGAKSVNIVGAGEPLLDPLFRVIVTRIAELGLTPVIFTNGILVAKNMTIAEFLRASGATVVLKFNALDSTVQDAVCGLSGYSDLADKALLNLIELGFADDTPTRLGLDTLAFKGNLIELPEIHSWCREYNVFPITAEFIPAGRTSDGRIDDVAAFGVIEEPLRTIAAEALRPLDPVDRDWLLRTISDIDSVHGIANKAPKAYFGGGGCTQLLGLYVDIQGLVWPCVARTRLGERGGERLPLGSIRNGDLPSVIWRSSTYLERLRQIYTGECPIKRPFQCLTIV